MLILVNFEQQRTYKRILKLKKSWHLISNETEAKNETEKRKMLSPNAKFKSEEEARLFAVSSMIEIKDYHAARCRMLEAIKYFGLASLLSSLTAFLSGNNYNTLMQDTTRFKYCAVKTNQVKSELESFCK